ncbi:hypothetical protein ACO22_07868 [Paracoccidioides brasiliensis]|uniref:Mitochondrial import inner membrane translocase subunit Tim21 n=1 Tax=Paracoccidioides brasiliensis TaxID=121759 RepID=A0A1D2J3H7_PARBR|nr:hypothetical protein ACO22_07868 [Paracoccidioides brasiliensis]
MTYTPRLRHALSIYAVNSATSHPIRPWRTLALYYATHSSLGGTSSSSSPPTRKQITVTSDDGRVRWGELSKREKAARATQQSANFLIIVIGAVMTGTVFTLLYKEVFAPDSKTRNFNRAADRIKEDSRCIELLGDKNKIRAYGETSWNKWTRNRPIATTIEKDRIGREHMKMNFNVSGPRNDGVVSVHLIKNPETHEYEYNILALDVKGIAINDSILRMLRRLKVQRRKLPRKSLGYNGVELTFANSTPYTTPALRTVERLFILWVISSRKLNLWPDGKSDFGKPSNSSEIAAGADIQLRHLRMVLFSAT